MVSLLLAAATASVGFIPPVSKVVVYEANLRALGPKVGFQALTNRLDAIKALGVNVLWVMPIHPVGKERSAGGLGSPYAVADFYGINPEFGTPDDFSRLVEAAHKRKMAVLLDWVPNHTSWDHPWIKLHADWYTKDAQGKITIPAGTNWQDVADLNYDNPELRAAMIAAMKSWILKYKIDGYRVDTADYLPFGFWKEALPQLRAASPHPIFMLAEGFRPDHYTAGFDLTFGWPFFDGLKEIYRGKSAKEFRNAVAIEHAGLPAGARRLRFVTNHDKAAWEGTTGEFFLTPQGAKAAFFAALFLGGTPLIYTGQEVDWQSRVPIFDHSTINWTQNPEMGKWIGQMVKLRNAQPTLYDGLATDLSTDDAIVYERKSGSARALIIVNVRNKRSTVELPGNLQGRWTNLLSNKVDSVGPTHQLDAYGFGLWIQQTK